MFCFILCVLLIGNIAACDFCQPTALGSHCMGEIVCPTHTKVVTVQCYVKEIISSEPIGQLLINGQCASIENFVNFCFNNNIREIVMLEAKSEPLICSGNFLLTNRSVLKTHSVFQSVGGGGSDKIILSIYLFFLSLNI